MPGCAGNFCSISSLITLSVSHRRRLCTTNGGIGVEHLYIKYLVFAVVCCSSKLPYHIIPIYSAFYTTIAALSSKFDEFLAARLQFDSDHRFNFYAHTCCQSATSGPLFAFYCPLFFTGKNNSQCRILPHAMFTLHFSR